MNFTDFSESFLTKISEFLPGVLGAIAVLIVGWIIASAVRRIITKILNRTDLDNKLFKGASNSISTEKLIAKLVYYLIMMIVLLVTLEMLGVHNVLDPVKNMANKFFSFIPNIIGAGIIGFVGYIVATIVSELVGMAGNTLGKFSNRLGMSEEMNLVSVLKKLVFAVVFIPILITALDTLQLTAISEPAKEMLSTFINAIPNIIVAGVIIAVFYIGGRFLSNFVGDLLKGMGTDHFAEKLQLSSVLGNTSLSKLVANVMFFFLLFTGIVTAVEQLHFAQLSDILNNVLAISGQIFFGVIIMVVGNFIANLAYKSMSQSKDNQFMASMARIAILGLFLAISLRSMGIANDIVNLAFGLTLGAVAVAIALSFGLGGREAAGKQMNHILKNFRGEESDGESIRNVHQDKIS